MNKNCFFSNAFKYVEQEGFSPFENFLTESFVFIIKYLINNFPSDAISILKLFGIEIKEERQLKEDLKVETQKTFYAPNDFKIPIDIDEARPDIVIYQSNEQKRTIIEVKVEASLNQYYLTNGDPIDQIDLYKNIKSVKKVFTLSKHFIDKNNFSNKVRWFQICELLNKNSSFVVTEFCKFLRENNMGERVQIKKESVSDTLNTIEALTSLIENAWSNSNMKRWSLDDYCISPDNIGFQLKKIGSKEKPFIGVNNTKIEKYRDAIICLVPNPSKKQKENYFEAFDDSEGYFVLKNAIKLKDIIDKDINEQEKILAYWLNNNVAPALSVR